jgi:SEFIR domain
LAFALSCDAIAVPLAADETSAYVARARVGNWRRFMAKRVFITYAHETVLLNDRVLELADRLRVDGVDASIDKYEHHPAQGWPKWMEQQLREAEAIVMVPSERYLNSYNQDAGVGSGSRFEGAIISSMLVKSGVSFARMAVVAFDEGQTRFIPDAFHGCPRYDLSTAEGYELLYRWLTDQPLVTAPPLGLIRVLQRKVLPQSTAGTDLGNPVSCFKLLCQALDSLLRENGRIFNDFGPNSGAQSTGPARFDLKIWHELRRTRIVPNNARIREVIKANEEVIPSEHSELFGRLLSHIDAFEAHVNDVRLDYREHQFPSEIAAVVKRYLT